MKERDVWKVISAQERGRTGVRWMRCENLCANGVPDINGCVDGLEFWLEIKCPRLHKCRSTPLFGSSHRISAAQFAWHKRQAQAGGHSAVLVCSERCTLLLDGARIDPSVHAIPEALIQQHPAVICMAEAPVRDAWPYVRLCLLHWLKGLEVPEHAP